MKFFFFHSSIRHRCEVIFLNFFVIRSYLAVYSKKNVPNQNAQAIEVQGFCRHFVQTSDFKHPFDAIER